MMPINLRSTANKIGKVVTQIIHFSGGQKITVEHIISSSIKQGEFTKMILTDGRMVMVKTSNVDMVEVFPEN